MDSIRGGRAGQGIDDEYLAHEELGYWPLKYAAAEKKKSRRALAMKRSSGMREWTGARTKERLMAVAIGTGH